MAGERLLKISELAERSGVSSTTIKHYLREGLLGGRDEVVKTSRNMAYYPPEYVERIRLIKRLQEERFLPLRHIKQVLDLTQNGHAERVPRADAAERHAVPENVLARLEELGVLGQEELRSILRDEGSIKVDCEFCNQHYGFDAADVDALYSSENGGDSPAPGSVLH